MNTTPQRRQFLAALAAGSMGLRSQAQQSTSYIPKQSDRPEPLAGEEPGFESIFDGKTLNGWEGDPKYWRVEAGDMVGEITPETLIKSNTFLIWRGGEPADFELKVDFRITSGGNSGINYRSVVVPDKVTPANRFAMRGYQYDMDGRRLYTANNYEEKGRMFLAERGQVTRITGKQKPIILANTGDSQELTQLVRDDWNSAHIIARGTVLLHHLNGRLAAAVIDDDPQGRMRKGLIGVQVHVGPAMQVRYRNWRLLNL
jgi:Domain of Unknown Function (DUF1080)